MRSRTRGAAVAIMLIIGLMISGCALPLPLVARHQPSVTPTTPPAPTRHSTPAERRDTPQPFPDDLPGGQPRGLTRAQQQVDRNDPDAVAAAFVVRLELWDTELDRRPNDAARRAAPYATAQLRARMLAATPEAAPGVRWTVLVEHHGWTTVTTELGGIGEDPPTTDTTAVRAVTPLPMDHGTDGWTSQPDPPGTYIVALTRVGRGRPWAVNSYTIQ